MASLRLVNTEPTHCKHGHLLNVSTTYHHPAGFKVCKVCRASQMSAYYFRKCKARRKAA